jgi:hypothetical protein
MSRIWQEGASVPPRYWVVEVVSVVVVASVDDGAGASSMMTVLHSLSFSLLRSPSDGRNSGR